MITLYLILGLIVVALVTIVARPWRFMTWRWLAALIALLVLTAVFDPVIVAAGIVTYDPAKILGMYVGAAPAEDFFYAVGALLIIPALWRRAGRAHD